MCRKLEIEFPHFHSIIESEYYKLLKISNQLDSLKFLRKRK